MIENCAVEGCEVFADFPDETVTYYCRNHYPGDPEFSHVPDEERREELRVMYDK